ncbi:MAG: efflux RND transporter periplasmic adaptor subunit, partial [Pseudomonadota bacterium]
ARLSTQTAGRVEALPVDVGAAVVADQLLLALDTELASLNVARAEAALAESQAELAEANRLAEEGRRLVRDRFLPDTEVRAREAAVVLAEAAVTRVQAELATERERKNRHELRAPFDGVIVRRLTERGEWVDPGSTVLELVSLDDLWLDVRVPQRYWAELNRGAVQVRAIADVLPGRPLAVEIEAIVPVSDQTARTFLLRLRVQDVPMEITPGMSAQVELDLQADAPSTLIPRDALLRYPDGTTSIWVVAAGSNVAEELAVTVQRLLSEQVELVEDLAADLRVVVRGNESLTEGETVQIVGESG